MSRRHPRPGRALPFTWRVGVNNRFGWLEQEHGHRLIEPRLFTEHDALVVDLHDGGAHMVAADGSLQFWPLNADDACALVGIPAPVTEGGGEVARRVDPFHVERHRSPVFCAVTGLCREQQLPCGYSLRAAAGGDWDGGYTGDDPEMFAAGVLERIARGCELDAAVVDELAADSGMRGQQLRQLLERTGWRQALVDLPGRVAVEEVLIAAGCVTVFDEMAVA